MRVNPVVDIFAFLTGPSYGEPVFMTVLYWIVMLATFAVAATAAFKLEGQASFYHIGRFIVRFIVGSMWWQQALWKFPTDLGGLQYWTERHCHGNLNRLAEARQDDPGSCSRCRSPSVKCPAPEDAERVTGCQVTLGVEGVVDGGVNRQEALS
ncbi:hypothetical protein SAMN05519103_06228 [Rhizobiales bacterium GAS113]|nr:hypothetical protein SAMN05519103_06228 [Rhizobiales bacterium GAS113]